MKKVNLEIIELEQKIAPSILNASLFAGIDAFNSGSSPLWNYCETRINTNFDIDYNPMNIIHGGGSGWEQTVSQTQSTLNPISVGYASNWQVTSFYADSAINYLHHQPGYFASQWSVTIHQTKSALSFLGNYNSFWY